MSNQVISSALDEIKGVVTQPDGEVFKIDPGVIQDYVSKLLVIMGAGIEDIKNISVSEERKKLRIVAIVDRDSAVFNDEDEDLGGLSLLGSTQDDYPFSKQAKAVLREAGFFYHKYDEDGDAADDVFAVGIEKTKKNYELSFDPEIAMAIITDTDFLDPYFAVDAVEEVVAKKKHSRKKFKGKKRTVVLARVFRSAQTEDEGFDAGQVIEYNSDQVADDDDEDDDE